MVPDDSGGERRIYHRSIEPTADGANVDLVQLVAEIEGCETADLPALWSRIDDVVKDVFTDPPSAEAQVHVEFTYAGYRIDVDQSGDVELMKVSEQPAGDV